MRTEWRNYNTAEAASASVSFSKDRGQTWTKPEFAFIGAVPDSVILPEGALLVATSFSRWRLSYDGGREDINSRVTLISKTVVKQDADESRRFLLPASSPPAPLVQAAISDWRSYLGLAMCYPVYSTSITRP